MPTVAQVSIKTLLGGLVQIPTLTDETATCQAAIDLIKYHVRDVPLHIHDLVYNDHPVLILTTRRTKRPKLMLHCHLDIAAAPVKQMVLTERDGRYYGRGVFDMKYAAAVYIQLLQELGSRVADYDLGVTFTTDEEMYAGDGGCAHAVRLGWGGGVVVNPDAIGNWNIERAAKGVMRVRVESFGESGHGSRPWQYRSAIAQLLWFLHDLAKSFPSEPCGDPEHGHDTLNVGTIEGGHMVNQVADRAVAWLDVRLMPGKTLEEMEAVLREVAVRHPYIRVTRGVCGPPISIDPGHREMQRLVSIIGEVAGTQPEFVLSHGGTENAHYVAKGMPVLTFGPPGGGHHSDDEWISVEGVDQFAAIIRRLVEEIARP